jgi:cytochrome c-type biogenesis protein CcmH/NrfF
MSALWLLPLAILATGMALTVILVRRLHEVTAGLQEQLARFGEVQEAVTAMRVETSAARSAIEGVGRR